jgi:hypothetical protein
MPLGISKDSGESITPTLTDTITTPESHASGRHLLEGSLPSGKRRNT